MASILSAFHNWQESKVLEEATTWNLEHAVMEPATFVSGSLVSK